MKKKIRDLTAREAQTMCKKREHKCGGCPLFFACYCAHHGFEEMGDEEIEVEE